RRGWRAPGDRRRAVRFVAMGTPGSRRMGAGHPPDGTRWLGERSGARRGVGGHSHRTGRVRCAPGTGAVDRGSNRDVNEGDVALACMRAFAGALVRAGVGEVGLSPGSRSTPLALAVAREPGMHAHVHLDERASAFFALGVAKATGHPAGVVTTSGT